MSLSTTWTTFLFLGIFFPYSVYSQTVTPPEPNELAAEAVAHFYAANEEATYYTFIEDTEISYFNRHDKRTKHSLYHGDMVMIDGLGRFRSASVDGKRLSAAELAANAASFRKYRTAHPVAEEDTVARVDYLPRLLATSFQNRLAGHEIVDGRDCYLLDSMPLPALTDLNAQNHIQLWIDVQTLNVLRYSFQYLRGPEYPADSGRKVTTYYTLVNGNPLKSRVEADMPSAYGHSTFVSTYRNYERFTTDIKLLATPN